MESGEGRKFGFTNDNRFAALFVGLGIIGQQTDADIGIWFNVQLSTQHVTITVVALYARWGFEIAVAFAPCAGQAEARNVRGDRYTDASLKVHEIVIAVTRVCEAFDFRKAWTLCRDVQRAGRSVAAKQCALRATQDFKPLKVDKVTQSNAWT